MEKDSQDMNTQYSDLISRYLSGNANSQEVRELEGWVLADPENKAQFMAFKKAWVLSGMKAETQTVDMDHIWAETVSQLWNEEPKVIEMTPQKGRRRLWLGVAAAIILLLVVSVVIFRNFEQEAEIIAETQEEVQEINLPDGSQITLNQASRVIYKPSKKSTERRVKLDGDAFFDIAKDEKRPFIIQADAIEIEVLGTSFYVDARKDQNEIQVVVASGVVAVRSENFSDTLRVNEKAVYLKATGQLDKQNNEDANFQSLKTNVLTFEDASLGEVVFALNRQFGANISLEEEDLKNCRLTAVFQQKSLESILTIIEATIGIQYRVVDEGIELYGNCNN